MKKIPLLFLLFSISLFSQSINSSKILNLRNEVSNSIINSQNFSSLSSIQVDEKKNVGLAIIYSLLLPGMGELYAGSYSSGKYFTIAEGALWATYLGFNTYGSLQKDNYKSFAAANAGVNNNGKNSDYYANVGLYTSINEYNNTQAFDRNFTAMYNTEQYYWNWTNQDRKTYRSMWLSSENAYNDLRFVVGAMILNRIISAINAVRLVSKYNKSVDESANNGLNWNLSVGLLNRLNVPSGLTVNLQTQF
ncbi:MAG: hypothetical protein WCE54_17670 [Ignavibacteriaceae bacterium]